MLQAKFDDFKHRIEAGSERFNQCEELAQKLIANESPYTQDIEKRQEQLRFEYFFLELFARLVNTSYIFYFSFVNF